MDALEDVLDGIKKQHMDKPQPMRDTLYGNIHVSIKSLDRFIIAMISLLLALIIIGTLV